MSDHKNKKNPDRIFGKESSDQIRNPDQMDEYIEVTTPRTWLIALALFLVLAALGFWGFLGRIPLYYQAEGVTGDLLFLYAAPGYTEDNTLNENNAGVDETENDIVALCLADPSKYNPRQLSDKRATVVFSDGLRSGGSSYMYKPNPLSGAEINDLLNTLLVNSDWVVSGLNINEKAYWYLVAIDLDRELDSRYWGNRVDISIITNEVAPISFLFQ